MQRLDDAHIPALVSPLHDMDVNEETGELKKEHHHVLMLFGGVKTEKQAKEVAESFGAANGHVERVNDAKAYARYLTHMDSPEGGPKVKYSPDNVICFGGADYSEIVDTTKEDMAKSIYEMQTWCVDNGIKEISDLMVWAGENRWDWYRCLTTSRACTVMATFLRSLRHKSA